MALSTAQLSLIEQRVSNDGPSAPVAYLLWFFFGLLGGHRFYLGRVGSGVVQALLSITVFGLFISAPWVLIDLFLINGMMLERRDQIRHRLMTEYMAMGGDQQPNVQPQPQPQPQAQPTPAVQPAVTEPAPALEAPQETVDEPEAVAVAGTSGA
jgi:TM2 domain-containing membrane protein YozV